MLFALYFSLFATTFISSVSAHGYLGGIGIDGTWYAGNTPNNYKGSSPIRLVNDIGPVKGADNPDIKCGLSAQNGAVVVPANPGSVVSFLWVGGGGGNWPHDTGPVMTYMASCGSTSCDQFDPSNAKWFKIDQAGRQSDGSWTQKAFQQRQAYQMNLPNNLAPGGYLIRHEIIALHLGMTMGGAEFYPACVQVMVGGNGNGQASPTVSFPGAYSDSDPGIYVPNIYDPGSNYTFPGGDVSNLAATNAKLAAGPTGALTFPSGTSIAPLPSPTGGVADPSPSAGMPAPTPTPTPSSPAGGASQDPSQGQGQGSCMLKRQNTNSNRPRHYSRIMRRIMHHSVV